MRMFHAYRSSSRRPIHGVRASSCSPRLLRRPGCTWADMPTTLVQALYSSLQCAGHPNQASIFNLDKDLSSLVCTSPGIGKHSASTISHRQRLFTCAFTVLLGFANQRGTHAKNSEADKCGPIRVHGPTGWCRARWEQSDLRAPPRQCGRDTDPFADFGCIVHRPRWMRSIIGTDDMSRGTMRINYKIPSVRIFCARKHGEMLPSRR